MKDLCGQQIDGYHAMRLLGRGGMAEVYEVRHDQLGVRRAMKVFTAEGERAELLKSRFLAEGRLLARLDHPRLVKVHDCGVDEATGQPYLVMDLVMGAGVSPVTPPREGRAPSRPYGKPPSWRRTGTSKMRGC